VKFKNYYKILGVSVTSTEEDIKKAYRSLAKKWHPDKNSGKKDAENMFKEISEAYDVLSDAVKRKTFDDFIKKSSRKKTYNYTAKTDSESNETEFSDFFKQFFKKKRKKTILLKGDDIRGKITIDLSEAYNGSVRIITLPEGKIRIKINPGIASDTILKISGKGKKSRYGGKNGDLYLRITVKNMPDLIRKGDDLYQKIEIDIYTAILKGKIKVQTLKGEAEITLPEQFDFKKKLVLKEYGMPVYGKRNEFGDLYIDFKYKIPLNLSEKEKILLKRLRKIRLEESRKHS